MLYRNTHDRHAYHPLEKPHKIEQNRLFRCIFRLLIVSSSWRYYRYDKEADDMAESRIPKSIRQYRPSPCTEIKLIGSHYYVYMCQSQKLKSGGWGKKTEKSIGKIVPGTGFIPNRNYHLYTDEKFQDEITVLEYGQYALIWMHSEQCIHRIKDLLPV